MPDRSTLTGIARAAIEGLKSQFRSLISNFPTIEHRYFQLPRDDTLPKYLLHRDRRSWGGDYPVEGRDYGLVETRPGVFESRECRFEAVSTGVLEISHELWLDGRWVYLRFYTPEPKTIWVGRLQGAGIAEFEYLAGQAGNLLTELRVRAPIPPEVLSMATEGNLPADALILPDNSQRWLRFLHWLAWSGGPMPVKRLTWGGDGQMTAALDSLEQATPPGSLFSPQGKAITFPPGRCFSVLENLFLRSSVALEWIEMTMSGGAVSTLDPTDARPSEGREGPEAPAEPTDIVTLQQAAAIVHKTKRTLRNLIRRGRFPDPVVEGGGGRSALYHWPTIRPVLEREYGLKLPERFPANVGR